jgi:hypothetical protein
VTVYRVLKWGDFERHIFDLKPSIIFYHKDKHPLRQPPIGLKLTFYYEQDTYAFLDFADGRLKVDTLKGALRRKR